MAIILAPNVVEVTNNYSATGFSLSTSGQWYGSTQNFANTAPQIGSQFYYSAYDGNGNNETGLLTWTTSGFAQRLVCLSSNSGQLVSFAGPVSVNGISNPSTPLVLQAWFSSLGTGLPGSANMLWNDGGTLAST